MKKDVFIGVLTILFVVLASQAGMSLTKLSAGNTYSLTTPPHDSLVVIAPNVFTPNGDGINDTWSIIVHDYGITILDLETRVYDRWGKQIFLSTNIREVWSGHNLVGKACDDGTYFFEVSYMNSATHKTEVHKGFIELLR